MNNWAHVKSDMARSLLEGRVFADKINLSIVIDTMLNEQAEDYVDMDIPEEVFWSRADALDNAIEAYMAGNFGLCMNLIKAFYLV